MQGKRQGAESKDRAQNPNNSISCPILSIAESGEDELVGFSRILLEGKCHLQTSLP
jgi:hypothetical protein